MYVRFGVENNKMNSSLQDLINNTYEGLKNFDLNKYYPFIAEKNVFENGTLHALMLTALTLLGNDLGASSINEKYIYNKNNAQVCKRKGKLVRPDCIWFNRGTGNPDVLIEFEQSDIKSKIENFIIMEDDLSGADSGINISKLHILISTTEKLLNFDFNIIFKIMMNKRIEIESVPYTLKNIPLLVMKLNYRKNTDSYIKEVQIRFERLFFNKTSYDFDAFKKIYLK